MKSLEQIAELYELGALEVEIDALRPFVPSNMLGGFGMVHDDGHRNIEFTREKILHKLEFDVALGFDKALRKDPTSKNHYEYARLWNWILGEGLERFDNYSRYGLPLFKATALKYGFPNPIGDDTGGEFKYDAQYIDKEDFKKRL